MANIHAAYMAAATGPAHLVCVPAPGVEPVGEWWAADDTTLYTALTGNGPTSEANAAFIAMARDAVPALVAEVRRLRSLLGGRTA